MSPARGAEHGIGHRVADDVGIRMPEAPVERNAHAAQDQRRPFTSRCRS